MRKNEARLTLCTLSLLLSLVMLFTAACIQAPTARVTPASTTADFTFVFAGDTHSHMDPGDYILKLNGKDTLVEMGGLPRLASAINDIRAKGDVILLHTGDVLFGTYYFIKYGITADADMLNSMGFNAVTVGNHDFDKGPQGLVELAAKSKVPFISANIDASRLPDLAAAIKPYVVLTRNGQQIGIIGLTATETPLLDPSGPDVKFTDPSAAARKAVDELTAQGVNKIVLLSHLGYERDMQLVKSTSGIDLVIGGHSHTLLGPAELQNMGLPVAGGYPTIVKNSDGQDVPIVHAWEYSREIGVIKASFDQEGKLISYAGNPLIVIGDNMKQADAQGSYQAVAKDSAAYRDISTAFNSPSSLVRIYPEDSKIKQIRDTYYQPISFLGDKIATADATLIDRDLAPMLADALMWKAGKLGMAAQFAFVPVSYLRDGRLIKGDFTGAPLYEFMPFASPLVVCETTGDALQKLIGTLVNNPNPYTIVKSGTPYLAVSGLKFSVDSSRPRNITDMKIMVNGDYVPVKPEGTYSVVTTARIAKGIFNVKQTADVTDSEVFIEYAKYLKNIGPVTEIRIVGW